MVSAINWFEIPAADFDRACTFYGAILGTEIQKGEMGPFNMGFLPAEMPGTGGAIVQGDGYQPSADGSVVYLNGGDDLNNVLNKVQEAGGTVIVPKTAIGNDYGYFALFMDSEGNKVGVHSMN